MLLNDDEGSTRSFTISFCFTVRFFCTAWPIFTYSFFINSFPFIAMPICYFKITPLELWHSNATQWEGRLSTSYWSRRQNLACNAPQEFEQDKKKSFNTKRTSETCKNQKFLMSSAGKPLNGETLNQGK